MLLAAVLITVAFELTAKTQLSVLEVVLEEVKMSVTLLDPSAGCCTCWRVVNQNVRATSSDCRACDALFSLSRLAK